ncbi:hypothetical protein ACP4OV_016690 [Aristida adscensionis]
MAPALPAKTPTPPPPPPPKRRRGKRRKPPPPEAMVADAEPTPPSPGLLSSPERKRRKTSPPPPPPPAKKPLPFQRIWPPEDEVTILKALAAHRHAHGGELPSRAALFTALDGRLLRESAGKRALAEKVRSLNHRYKLDSKKEARPADKHKRLLYRLSSRVWGAGKRSGKGAAAQAQAQDKSPGEIIAQDENTGERAGKDATQADSAGEQIGKVAQAPCRVKTLNEMRELYPYLVDEAMVRVNPAALERTLQGIDDKEAQALDSSIKNMRKQLNRTIPESARMKNMEMPTVCLCPSTRLQPEKWREGNENKLFLERLARVEREIVELGQILRVSRSQPKIEHNWPQDISSAKGIRCESAESHVHSVVSENQIQPNIQQKKIEASKSLLPGKADEVTTKYRFTLPRNNLPCSHAESRVIMQPEKFRGRRKKLETESQTLPNVIEEMKVTADAQQDLCHDRNGKGEKEVVLLSIVRPHTPVAKAILQPSSQSTKVGDAQLGSQYCKVFVNDVLQRDAPLSRPYGKMTKMIHALKCSIAWPRELVKSEIIPLLARQHLTNRPVEKTEITKLFPSDLECDFKPLILEVRNQISGMYMESRQVIDKGPFRREMTGN